MLHSISQINAVTPHHETDYRFLYALLLSSKTIVQRASTNSMKGMVSKGKLEAVPMFAPSTMLQRTFGTRFDAILRVNKSAELARVEVNNLFESAVRDCFTSEQSQ